MKKICDRVYCKEGYSETDRPVLGLIAGQNLSVMVDAGNSPRHALDFKKELDDHSLPFPDLVVITHAHCDHVFGTKEMNCLTIANRLTSDRLRELKHMDWNEPALMVLAGILAVPAGLLLLPSPEWADGLALIVGGLGVLVSGIRLFGVVRKK